MVRQELGEKLEFEKAVGLRGGFSSTGISILKFVLSIILLPLVIGFTISFSQQLINQGQPIINSFIFAIVTYLILHIFVYEPGNIYDTGQGIIGRLFGFFVPLRRLLYYSLPAYAILFFILYFIFKMIFGHENIIGYFIFLISFFAIMHLILTAAYFKKEPLGVLGGDYFFSLFLVYLFEIILLSGFFSVMLEEFSFISFIKEGCSFFAGIHIAIWRQLFVLK